MGAAFPYPQRTPVIFVENPYKKGKNVLTFMQIVV